ncbi:hypothetical protein [Polaribacter sp. M15]
MKKIITLFALSILLMAFQCEDEPSVYENYEFNKIKVNITPKSSFKKSDTIWIEGIVSSNVYDKIIQDSIFYEIGFSPAISLYKLVKPENNATNSKDAVDKFEIIYDTNKISFLGRCENSTFFPETELSDNEKNYKYKLGLKPLLKGDYIINFWNDSKILNTNLNDYILNDYRLINLDTKIGFNSCGRTSYKSFENENTREYFFTVE